jgi:hypothetical protein
MGNQVQEDAARLGLAQLYREFNDTHERGLRMDRRSTPLHLRNARPPTAWEQVLLEMAALNDDLRRLVGRHQERA